MSYSNQKATLVYTNPNVGGIVGGADDENATTVSADQVLPGLWIGNQAASQSESWLKSHNIRTVFNATKHLPFANGRVEIRIPVNDPGPFNDLDQDDVARMYRALPCAVDMLHDSLSKGGVLVHCHAGMQRSAAVVTAYLAKYYFHNLDKSRNTRDGSNNVITPQAANSLYKRSKEFLLSKRSKVFYNGWYVNFEKAIKKYIQTGMNDANLSKCGNNRS